MHILTHYLMMKALLAACKPLILLDFRRSFNDTRTRSTFNCKMSDVAQNDSTKRIALSPKQQKL